MQPDPRPHPAYSYYPLSLRFFNVYGPRQDPSSPYSGILSLFIKHVLARTSPTIFGDGEQSRDFTYVEDVAELCVKAAHAEDVAGRMYNAGNVRHSIADTALVTAALGHAPRFSIEEGLRRTLEWFRREE